MPVMHYLRYLKVRSGKVLEVPPVPRYVVRNRRGIPSSYLGSCGFTQLRHLDPIRLP